MTENQVEPKIIRLVVELKALNLEEGYQRFLSPGFKPFNPLKLADETEKIVTRQGEDGLERKYTDFYSVQPLVKTMSGQPP